MKPSSIARKTIPSARPASAKIAGSNKEAKENEGLPETSGKPRPSSGPLPKSRAGISAAPLRNQIPAGNRPASSANKPSASSVPSRVVRKPAAGAPARRQPGASGGDSSQGTGPPVRSGAPARRGPPRPRGLATVGAAAPLFANPGDQKELHPAIIKAARRSGQLNLSSRDLAEVPAKVWRINEIDNDEAKQLAMSMDGGEERWWDQVPLTKLLLCGNQLKHVSDELGLLTHLQTLDLHDNALAELPASVGELHALTRLVLSHNQLRRLPEELFAVTSLRQLLADHNRLEQLPEQAGDCLDLELLDVSHNCLTSLPAGLGYLHKVSRLAASDNQLETVPDELGSMTSAGHTGGGLRALDLARNRLGAVPASLGQLYQLEVLDLRQNLLTEMPPLTDCHALKELHLGFNQVKEIGVELLESLKSLIILDLSNNKIESLPDDIAVLQRLERLDLKNNDLSVAPLRLCLLPLLKSVQLEGNPLRSVRRDLLTRSTQQLLRHFRERLRGQAEVDGLIIPGLGQRGESADADGGQTPEQARMHEVYKMKSSRLLSHTGQKAAEIPPDLFTMGQEAEVTTVDFSKNLLTSVSDSLLLLSGHLAELNLNSNRLTALPEALGQCCRLTYLNVSGNQLTALPDSLGTLKYLREVCLTLNRFTAVPPVLYGVASLEIILASDNQITEIEVEQLRRLGRLATLDLRNNSIPHVPARLGTVTQLRSLSLEGNLFKQPRPTVLAQGTASVLQYLRDRIPSAERDQ
ncbi:leucine-rich repeat-containing protein 40-like isoform X2 [Pollicipes pollicipes]|uniref:leucine-rich repeat-containing protein 40-like isoform X2 n=1 Tax=Pollicipes pollicipes TaxID=41117 RepID=UPI00188592B7|nr:leucine-rich repeat-containing protein 40-like isoform X2 [Pollicipes pollicipes]